MTTAVLKKLEETKRERNWNPARRWQALQNAITWAESQAAVRRKHTPAARRREEARKLASSA